MRTKRVKPAPVGVIGKVFDILELLNRCPAGLQLKQIAEKTKINKSTTYRFLSHLEYDGYLFRDVEGAYMLAPRLARLGSGFSFYSTLCKICRPTLENLQKVTGETINLAVLDGFDVLYLDVLETLNAFRLVSEIGMRRPAYCTALGKAILANIDDEQRKQEIFSSITFGRTTPRTITTIGQLTKQLTQIREKGFSLDDEEAVTGARCLGSAIKGANGEVVGAISMSGPVVRITSDRLPFFTQEICKASREISWRLGHRLSKTAQGIDRAKRSKHK